MNTGYCRLLFLPSLVGAFLLGPSQAGTKPDKKSTAPHIVGHRGLMLHAPENTLAGFGACMELRLGFELDVRRSKDGQLVCIHDDDVKRTTDGTGKVTDFTLAGLRKLDAGRWFHPEFSGQRAPGLEEVLVLLKARQSGNILIALDIKVEDIEAELSRLVEKHGLLDRVLCIGLAIGDAEVRRKLRQASPKIPVAVLAPKVEDVPAALNDAHADWIYIRFLPTREEVARMHQAGKRVFLSGPLVSGNEPANWSKGLAAGIDALLTDYPLECRQTWKAR